MSEEQAGKLIQEMQMVETYILDMNQRENTLLSLLREAAASIDSLKSLKEKPTSETLMPLGMGTYVQGTISSNNNVFLNIGAGIVVEKDTDSAINYLEARIKEIQVAIQETLTKKQNAMDTLERGKAQINQLMQATSQSQG